MKFLFFCMVVSIFAFCKEEPHLKHKLAFTKSANECLGGEFPLKFTSNINGERYEFKQCLPQEFNGQYTLNRVGDTLVLQFPGTPQTTNAFFDLVLDVDAFPKYGYLKMGDQLLKLGPPNE